MKEFWGKVQDWWKNKFVPGAKKFWAKTKVVMAKEVPTLYAWRAVGVVAVGLLITFIVLNGKL